MNRKHILSALVGALSLGAVTAPPTAVAPQAPRQTTQPADSALDELSVGRYWHAARILRAEGAADESADRRLLLARAEAGWKSWGSVVELIEGSPWPELAERSEARGLLARALEEQARWSEAADAYERYLRDATETDVRIPALARRARSLARSGDMDGAVSAIDAIPPEGVIVGSWMAVELAQSAGEQGDTAVLSRLVDRIVDARARQASWRIVPETRLEVGDSVGSEAAYREAMGLLRGSAGRDAGVEIGRLRLAAGDTTVARSLLLEGMEGASGRGRTRAAAPLVDIGGFDRDFTLELASILDRAGDGRRALRSYDRAAQLTEGGAALLPEWARLARARLMATVRARQADAVEEFRAIRSSTQDPDIGARNLQIWMSLRRRQSRTGDVNTLRGWLLEEYPASAAAAEIVWERGSTAEARGDLDGALRHYTEVASNAWSHTRAGRARMRIGQIHLGQGRPVEAAEVYEAYLRDFPDGRRWEEASYWAARSRLEAGDTAAARTHLSRVQTQEPVSYYAVMGANLLGEEYHVDFPPGSLREETGWLRDGLRRLDLLIDAGLDAGADSEEARLIARARGVPGLMLTLGEELNARGRTIAGINLGWELLADGHPWDQRLVELVYPFLYRELVQREAAEWGVDPIMLAALIRQESAFKADIVSHAGAIGLMQVMPATGGQLARAHGPEPFDAANLTTPEVNLHLGAAFFVEMSERYGELPLILSAYNAGPTRATRWRRYPEMSDPLRFTERIPFDETRGYVKNIRRNLGLYQILYGAE